MALNNYPPGVSDNTPGTPWNEPVVPEREFDITISQTLSKTVTVTTDDYIPEVDSETGELYTHTNETNWYEVYEEQHYTITELLEYLEIYIKDNLKDTNLSNSKRKQLQHLLDSCKDWIVDDYCIEE